MRKKFFYITIIVGGIGILLISIMVGRFLGNYLIKKVPLEVKKDIYRVKEYSSLTSLPSHLSPEVKIIKMKTEEKTQIKEEKKEAIDLKKEKKINTEKTKTFYVQVGAFKNRENALKLSQELQSKGYSSLIKIEEKGSEKIYKVQIGTFQNKETALSFSANLKNQGYTIYISSE